MVWGSKGNTPQDETPSMPDKPVTRKALPAELKDILERDDHESYDESYAS